MTCRWSIGWLRCQKMQDQSAARRFGDSENSVMSCVVPKPIICGTKFTNYELGIVERTTAFCTLSLVVKLPC